MRGVLRGLKWLRTDYSLKRLVLPLCGCGGNSVREVLAMEL